MPRAELLSQGTGLEMGPPDTPEQLETRKADWRRFLGEFNEAFRDPVRGRFLREFGLRLMQDKRFGQSDLDFFGEAVSGADKAVSDFSTQQAEFAREQEQLDLQREGIESREREGAADRASRERIAARREQLEGERNKLRVISTLASSLFADKNAERRFKATLAQQDRLHALRMRQMELQEKARTDRAKTQLAATNRQIAKLEAQIEQETQSQDFEHAESVISSAIALITEDRLGTKTVDMSRFPEAVKAVQQQTAVLVPERSGGGIRQPGMKVDMAVKRVREGDATPEDIEAVIRSVIADPQQAERNIQAFRRALQASQFQSDPLDVTGINNPPPAEAAPNAPAASSENPTFENEATRLRAIRQRGQARIASLIAGTENLLQSSQSSREDMIAALRQITQAELAAVTSGEKSDLQSLQRQLRERLQNGNAGSNVR